ncbi:unnamed protein product [Rotaria socialis]
MTETISKNNETDDFIGIFPVTVEFMVWKLHPYDKNGKEIPFQGVRYCTDNDTCQCKRCKKNRMNEWPYERSLCANLLYLTGIHINDINYNEIIKFEETLVSDYLRHIGEFWKYVTELCLLAGENGIEILGQFNNGLFDKPFNQFNKCQTTRMIPSSTSIQPMKVHHLSKEDWRKSSQLIPNYDK